MKSEVTNFARSYNDSTLINRALSESKADIEYQQAARAFDEGRFDDFINNFFLAIHSRYDIEKPEAKRLIRLKLNQIKPQSAERGTRPPGGTVAERLPAMSAAAPTRSATMSKPSMEAEPMRGRTSTPAAGRQGTGKGARKRRGHHLSWAVVLNARLPSPTI